MKSEKRFFLEIFKAIFITIGILWIFGQIISTVAFDQSVELFSKIFDIDESEFIAQESSSVSVDFIDQLLSDTFFHIFLLTSFAFSFLGAVLLAKKRSVYAFIGLFAAFVIPSYRDRYGRVIDIHTHKPIPFATIRIYKRDDSNSTQLLKESLSDTEGHYKVDVNNEKSENLIIEVKASGYLEIRSKPLVTLDGEITQDIYMSTQLNKTGSYYDFLSSRSFLFDNLTVIIYLFSIIYFLIFSYYFAAYPTSWYGIANFLLFSVALFLNTRVIYKKFLSKKGSIREKISKKPIVYANVSIFNDERQLESRYTDEKGRVRFDIASGNYRIKVQKVGFDISSEKFWKVRIGKNGFLQSDIYLDSEGNNDKNPPTVATPKLANPFA